MSVRRTRHRTSLIVDPADGDPANEPDIQKQMAAERDLGLLFCRTRPLAKTRTRAVEAESMGRLPRGERRFRRVTARATSIESIIQRIAACRSVAWLQCCLISAASVASYSLPGSVSIFYDVGQGAGWQRIVPVDGRPQLPGHIRLRFGDSRGRWEGQTLVVDVTNFDPSPTSWDPARTCI